MFSSTFSAWLLTAQIQDVSEEAIESTTIESSSRTQILHDAFEPPEGDSDDVDMASEHDTLVPQEQDPGRFGIFTQPTTIARHVIGSSGNDGVFSNMSAKPEVGEEKEEHPPVSLICRCHLETNCLQTYEQASADNAPPYWDTTMYLPGSADDVYIDGLAVGYVVGFIWNMLVSMSFQFVGFLLTYILHTTHASKQGSRAGLGITLIQYGFYLRAPDVTTLPGSAGELAEHEGGTTKGGFRDALGPHVDYAAYALMLLGWIILTKSTADFLKVRKLEAAVRETSTSEGAAPAVVAYNETPENAV